VRCATFAADHGVWRALQPRTLQDTQRAQLSGQACAAQRFGLVGLYNPAARLYATARPFLTSQAPRSPPGPGRLQLATPRPYWSLFRTCAASTRAASAGTRLPLTTLHYISTPWLSPGPAQPRLALPRAAPQAPSCAPRCMHRTRPWCKRAPQRLRPAGRARRDCMPAGRGRTSQVRLAWSTRARSASVACLPAGRAGRVRRPGADACARAEGDGAQALLTGTKARSCRCLWARCPEGRPLQLCDPQTPVAVTRHTRGTCSAGVKVGAQAQVRSVTTPLAR